MIFFDRTRETDTLKTIQQQSLEQPITLFIDEFQEFLRINASIYIQFFQEVCILFAHFKKK